AYAVHRHGPPVGEDLGPADEIDSAIGALRQALRDPSRMDVKRLARAVDERVMRPLRTSLGEATRLLISPDGGLNLLPFEALVAEDGRYLIEQYTTSYLTSGRDLLRMQVRGAPRSPPVIVADPLFGEPAFSDRGVSSGFFVTPYFAPLGASVEEARAIKRLFPMATVFTGPRATKAALRQLIAPRMLHIASHGFFLQDARDVDNPLLRSGLPLAGAHLGPGLGTDGILTALEAVGLNLWGTKLVTLSACDTGVGEVRNGEGIYGLRRAFVLAGTETLVMSLWQVSDYVSRETMAVYYSGLRDGLGR